LATLQATFLKITIPYFVEVLLELNQRFQKE